MATNLIANGNFSDGDLHWTKGYWYAGNTVTWHSSGGQEGGCMELSVPSVGDPGQSSIAQNVLLKGGLPIRLPSMQSAQETLMYGWRYIRLLARSLALPLSLILHRVEHIPSSRIHLLRGVLLGRVSIQVFGSLLVPLVVRRGSTRLRS